MKTQQARACCSSASLESARTKQPHVWSDRYRITEYGRVELKLIHEIACVPSARGTTFGLGVCACTTRSADTCATVCATVEHRNRAEPQPHSSALLLLELLRRAQQTFYHLLHTFSPAYSALQRGMINGATLAHNTEHALAAMSPLLECVRADRLHRVTEFSSTFFLFWPNASSSSSVTATAPLSLASAMVGWLYR